MAMSLVFGSLPAVWKLLATIVFIPLTVCIFYYSTWIIYARFFHPLARFPGPFFASFSKLWRVFQLFEGKTEQTQLRLHKKYGPIVRVGPNYLSISDPAAMKVIYGVKRHFPKTDEMETFKHKWARYPSHLTNIDPKSHAERRRIVSNLFTMNSILSMEPYIDSCSEMLAARFEEFAQRAEPVNLALWTQLYAFDVIGELYFGEKFGFIERGYDHTDWMRSIDALAPFLNTISQVPRFVRTWIISAPFLSEYIGAAVKALSTLEQAAGRAVQNRLQAVNEGKSSRKDFLSELVNIYQTRGAELDYSPIEIKQEAHTAIFAGSDSTSIALLSILYHLMKNPEHYERLQKELDTADQNGQLSRPFVRYNEAVKLAYLSACVKEGMRIFPSAPNILSRFVPEGGSELAGQMIPEGTSVGCNPYVIHMNKGVFGEDAEVYNPERWLRPGAEIMDSYMLQFGQGPRICLGRNISLCEMYKLIPQMLRFPFQVGRT